jgi:hypothetical protein
MATCAPITGSARFPGLRGTAPSGAANTEQHRPTMRDFKIAYGKLGKQLRGARERLSTLTDKRPRSEVGDSTPLTRRKT